jgi:hypothetical protein
MSTWVSAPGIIFLSGCFLFATEGIPKKQTPRFGSAQIR